MPIKALPLRLFVICFFVPVVTVGCGDDWANRFTNGKSAPNSRIEVKLDQPVPTLDLYYKFRGIAIASDLTVYRGQPVTDEALATPGLTSSFNWYPVDEIARGYHISFLTYPYDSATPSSFVVILHNSRAMTNGEQEWGLFNEWYNHILPEAFPNAAILIQRHPAAFTPKNVRLDLQEKTGLVMPEEYK